MAVADRTKVYKNEDANNPEYATVEEVQRAFFGRGVFIKTSTGDYEQVVAFNPIDLYLATCNDGYTFAKPGQA